METMHEIGLLQTMIQTLEQRLGKSESELHKLHDQFRDWKNKAHAHCPACGNRSLQNRKPQELLFSDRSLSDAVIETLFEYDYPISSRTLKLRLLEKGYPQEKLGRYANRLHTVIWRLIEGGRIRREEGDEIVAIR